VKNASYHIVTKVLIENYSSSFMFIMDVNLRSSFLLCMCVCLCSCHKDFIIIKYSIYDAFAKLYASYERKNNVFNYIFNYFLF